MPKNTRNRGSTGRSHGPKHLSPFQQHLVAATGEFVGTFLFLFFAFAGHQTAVSAAVDSRPSDVPLSNQTMVYISLAYSFSLLVTAWSFYRMSGGLFNPAVTLGMCASGSLPWLRGIILFPAQILGAMVAGAIASALFPEDIAVVNTKLAPDVSIVRGIFIEMFLTIGLVFTVLMLAAEKSKDTFLAPIGIGLALFVVEIAGVRYTGASVNPARSFGPAVAALEFPAHHWIYWVGPLLGAIVTAIYFRFLKMTHYEEANPGQDSDSDSEGEV